MGDILAGTLISTMSTRAYAAQGGAPVPLEDPIPRKIPQGEVIVKAVPFLQVPMTRDP